MLWPGKLPITLFDVPKVLGHKRHRKYTRKNKRIKGRSIEERPQNERQNGMLRDYIPKGTSIERFSDEDILNIADELNQRPRRSLGYHSPIELFDDILDRIYAIEKFS